MRGNQRLGLDSASDVGKPCIKREKGQYLSSPAVTGSQFISHDVSLHLSYVRPSAN